MLYDKIKCLCAKSGISIARMERETDLGVKTVQRWNEISPSVDKVKRVADYFGVTVDELMGERT